MESSDGHAIKSNHRARLDVEEIEIARLIPAPYNPQRMTKRELKGLASSIRRYGFVQPIVVNRRGTAWPEKERGLYIVGGHQRCEALRSLGREVASCTVVELQSGAEKELNLALNNHGEFDVVNLGGLLLELQGLQFDLEPLGMEASDVALAARLYSAGTAKDDEERVPDLPAKPKTATGDLLAVGRHRIFCGDSTDPENARRLLEGAPRWSVLSDPPYGADVENDYSQGGFRRTAKRKGRGAMRGTRFERTIGDDAPFDPAPLFALYPAKEMFLFGADYYARRLPEAETGSWLVWAKRPMSGGAGGVGSHFELIWSRCAHQRLLLMHVWSGAFTSAGTDRDESVNRAHPNLKPTSLLRDIITRWTKPGDIVVDPYLGAGSTLLACEQTGRRCFGAEIDPRYCDVTVARWEAERQRLAARKASA